MKINPAEPGLQKIVFKRKKLPLAEHIARGVCMMRAQNKQINRNLMLSYLLVCKFTLLDTFISVCF